MKEADDSLIKRGWTPSEVGLCINNFLVLIEMLFIGIGMSYAFHYTGWYPLQTTRPNNEALHPKALYKQTPLHRFGNPSIFFLS